MITYGVHVDEPSCARWPVLPATEAEALVDLVAQLCILEGVVDCILSVYDTAGSPKEEAVGIISRGPSHLALPGWRA